MQVPPVPHDEANRLRALQALDILDTPAEERFDRLTRLAQRMFGTQIALVSLVDEQRQWFKSRQGLPAEQTERDISFCGHTILKDDILEISDARADTRFADNPLVTGPPHIRFYAGAPLRTADGYRVGTLCLIDDTPRCLSNEERKTLQDFAALVESELNAAKECELKRVEENLRVSRDQYASLVNNIPGVTYRCLPDSDRTMLYVSQQVEHMLGYTAEELVQSRAVNITDVIHGDDVKHVQRMLTDAVKSGRPWQIDYRVRHRTGLVRWVQDRGRVMHDAQGQLSHLEGLILDISGEKQAQESVRQHVEALTTLNEIASNAELSIEEQLTRALKLGVEHLQLDLGIISEIHGDRYYVNWFAAPAGAGLSKGQSFELGQTYCSITLQSRDVVDIAHMAESEFKGHPCYANFGLESYIGIPVEVANRRYGTLNFSSPGIRRQPFSETERMFVRLLAGWVGAALERHDNQQRLHKIADQVPGMVFQFQRLPDGSITFPYSSPGIIDIYGVTPREAQQNAETVFGAIHPEDLQSVNDATAESAANMSIWRCQYRVVKPDGSVRWIQGQSAPEKMTDGSILWHGYLNDITEQKHAEQVMMTRKARLRSLFELSPLGIALMDHDSGQLVEANEALLQATGYSDADVSKLNYRDFIPPEEMEQELARMATAKAAGRFGPYETTHLREDGSTYPVLVSSMVIHEPPGNKFIWCIVEDITESKRVERMKNEFVSTVSHELRTPLTSIAGSLGLIHGGALGSMPDRAAQVVEIAYKNSKRLTRLINDLLDMDKLLSGNMRMDLRQVPLRTLVQQSIENNKGYADQYGVTVKLSTDGHNAHANVDIHRFEQVMANLLSNACKFSSPGSTVEVRLDTSPGTARVSVQDYGPGVPDEFYDHLFEKFSQADASDSRIKSGTGLGLAISKEIVEQLGGTIGCVSKVGEGAQFYFYLPLTPERDAL